MHCGYYIPWLEHSLNYCYINTSIWHNKHHSLRDVHFGEMTIIWDLLMGTHSLKWEKQKVDDITDAALEHSRQHRRDNN